MKVDRQWEPPGAAAVYDTVICRGFTARISPISMGIIRAMVVIAIVDAETTSKMDMSIIWKLPTEFLFNRMAGRKLQ